MASTMASCSVCGAAIRVVLPESTLPLTKFGGEDAQSFAVPAEFDGLCGEHRAEKAAADKAKAEKAAEKPAEKPKAK